MFNGHIKNFPLVQVHSKRYWSDLKAPRDMNKY